MIVGIAKKPLGTGSRRSAARVRNSRFERALREVLDLCVRVETGELTAEAAAYQAREVASAELTRYAPAGLRER